MYLIRKMYRLVLFVLFYMQKFIKANLSVAYDVLTPKHLMKPGIIEVPLEVKSDLEILILNNLVTMTPGTICIDIDDEKSTMYVHAMYIENRESMLEEVKALENKIKKLFHHD